MWRWQLLTKCVFLPMRMSAINKSMQIGFLWRIGWQSKSSRITLCSFSEAICLTTHLEHNKVMNSWKVLHSFVIYQCTKISHATLISYKGLVFSDLCYSVRKWGWAGFDCWPFWPSLWTSSCLKTQTGWSQSWRRRPQPPTMLEWAEVAISEWRSTLQRFIGWKPNHDILVIWKNIVDRGSVWPRYSTLHIMTLSLATLMGVYQKK